jgi:exosome complex component RRP45
MPLASTFSLMDYNGLTDSILDPTEMEENVSQGKVIIVVNAQREICMLQKTGGLPCEIDLVQELSEFAANQALQLCQTIQTFVAKSLSKKET